MGGVSLGTTAEGPEEGAGKVRWTIWSALRRWVEAKHAPEELIFNVFVSSMNSAPEESIPRKKTGTCNRIRGERRDWEGLTLWPSFRRLVRTGILLVPWT